MTARRRTHLRQQADSVEPTLLLQRGRAAIVRIITLEASLEDLPLPELRFTVSLLEWFAGMPVRKDP